MDGERNDQRGNWRQRSGWTSISTLAPNPDCADAYYAENLALQMTLSVDLDSARVVDCAGATQTVTGSTATFAWIGLRAAR